MTTNKPDPSLANSTASAELVSRFQAGDAEALERLWTRYLPRLKKWAHGRLPRASQASALDTDDLVQEAFIRSLAHLRTWQPKGGQSVPAYFKTIILNQVRDHLRQTARRPTRSLEGGHEPVDDQSSPLEQLLGGETLERYQTALMGLRTADQEMVLAVVELRLSDTEVTELFQKPTIRAARMARGRALAKLARAMEAIASGDHDAEP
jgi:RNA polymerase sigma-70 factor, ECF subfamily